MNILPWNATGVLPPVMPDVPGNSTERSPYITDLPALISRFSTSPERIHILDGFLRFRRALHQAGIVSGFQWLDGSFLENVEALENRPPRDIDVVNFVDLSGMDQHTLISGHNDLFDHAQAKQKYALDAYFMQIGGALDQNAVRRVSYWYSMWSHRRNGLWKGFVQVDLAPTQDTDANAHNILNLQRGKHHDR